MREYLPENLPLYQSIIENYPGSVLVVDRGGTVIFCNRGSIEASGRTEDQIVGWTAYELMRQKVFSRSVLVDSLESGQVTIRYLIINDDENNGMLATGIPVFDSDGSLTHVIAFSQAESFAKEYYAKLEEEKQQLRKMFHYILDTGASKEFVAESAQMRELFHFAETISGISATIIVYGESGTGKEVLVRHIHKCSTLSDQIFLPVNCAAIPKDLMESEFFGYEKGAFTGASREGKPGIFELADKGTLFLDEIGELPWDMQSKLLRVLESGEFKRLGGKSIKTATVRIIAATNRDLLGMVNRGMFREDLYYRLNVIPLRVPPLRERPEDLEPLISFFTAKFNQKHHLSTVLPPETVQELKNYSWPGNVRELKNVVERLVITGGMPASSNELFGPSSERSSVMPAPALSSPCFHPAKIASYREYISAAEREYLKNALASCHGNVAEMAAKAGLHISGVYRKLEKYQLEPKSFRQT